MPESAFLQKMRVFNITLNQSSIACFGIGSMKARLTGAHMCPTGLVFGGNIAFLLALWSCAKKGINQHSKGWEFNCKFKSPAPISEEFSVRLDNGKYDAARFGQVFAKNFC